VDVTKAETLGDIPHGFLGRKGGLSEGIYVGLNVGLGSDDAPEIIEQNRILAAEAILPEASLNTLYQVHSADVVTLDSAIPFEDRPQADAMVTNTAGLLLGILTADCVPVLFHDPVAKVIGAAHAGWKGAIAGVTDNVLEAMEAIGANRANVRAAIGPCIAKKSYEVDAGFQRRFCEQDPANERFFVDGKPEHYQFDIEAYVAHRLANAGLKKIEMLGLDTYSDASRFYSYRRSCHNGEDGYGRQIALIGLKE